jgi:hypothetical protein
MGEYAVYDSVEEFRRYLPEAKMHRWGEGDIADYHKGDFVEALDGYVVQILHTLILKTKNPTRFTTLIKFPQGTFGVYTGIKGVKFPNFYAQFAMMNKNRMSQRNDTDHHKEKEKKRFALMLCQKINPYEAYKMCFNQIGYKSVEVIERRIQELLTDPVVIEEIKDFMSTFTKKAQEVFTEEVIIGELKKLLEGSTPGSQNHRENLLFTLKVAGWLEPTVRPGPKPKAIDTPYENVPPPLEP